MKYKIYHIPGVKIGVSTNPKRRVKQQGYTNYEILEEHNCIYTVSDREEYLKNKYGYYEHSFVPYYQTIQIQKKGQNRTKKPIICLKYPSMEFYKKYNSTAEASRDLNIQPSQISQVLKNYKYRHQCHGYTFKYSTR